MASNVHSLLEKYKFTFLQPIPERLKCTICRNLLTNAKQTPCGCKVCEKCIKDYLNGDRKECPSKQIDCDGIKMEFNDLNPDNATNREIGNLKVKCYFDGCEVVDLLRVIAGHMEKCNYREIKCDKCEKLYSAKDKQKHDLDICEMRIVECKYCYAKLRAIDYDRKHLVFESKELCPRYKNYCPNDCGEKQMVILKDHQKFCTNKRLECPLKALICESISMTKPKLDEHLKEEQIAHCETLIKEIKQLNTEIDSLIKDLEKHKQIRSELDEVSGKASESLKKLHSDISIINQRNLSSSTLASVASGSSTSQTVLRNSVFIWKITNFLSLKNDAEVGSRVSITSDPFYTSDFGYKMCLRIYPAGDGVGRSTHLSVFFAIMRSEYDDLLVWPFKQKVTLSLLEQDGGTSHHSDTFKPDARSACYQKPTDESNIASGSPKFISLTNLFNSNNYYKNDTIYIKAVIDQTGIAKP